MADFNKFYPGLIAAEGGYVHDLADSGGETYRGIARAYHPQWGGWKDVDAAKLAAKLKSPVPRAGYAVLNKALAGNAGLQQQIKSFYKAQYWDVLHLDAINRQCLAEQLADHGVNAGTARPARMLQFCLNQLTPGVVLEDGDMGPKTIAAANAADARALFDKLVALRRAFYQYRAGVLGALIPEPHIIQVLNRLKVTPNQTQAKFLPSWLGRVKAIAFA